MNTVNIMNKINVDDAQEIKKTILENKLGRNKHINNLINIFSSMPEPIVISIDGNWGTGKTVFLKQFDYLVNSGFEDAKEEFKNLSKLQSETEVLYFNSWENDLHDNPLLTMLVLLVEESKKEKEVKQKYGEVIFKTLKMATNIGIKYTTAGAVELDDLKFEESKIDHLTESILSTNEVKSHITKFLDVLTKEKKMIIIVDELDRCKPTFAIELLEVVKHYFEHPNVSFIMCSNKAELSHTVENYYGQNFSGYEYLDRFIDFEYNLPEPKTSDYMENVLGCNNFQLKYYSVEVANFFKLSLRQANKYVVYMKMMWKSHRINNRHKVNNERHLIFAHYLIGLKIKSIKDYQDFINGEGYDQFRLFLKYSGKKFNSQIRNGISTEDREETNIVIMEIEYKKTFIDTKNNADAENLYDFLKLLEYI